MHRHHDDSPPLHTPCPTSPGYTVAGLLSLGAIALRNGTITTVANASRDWATKLIGQPDILGVDHIDPQGILLKNSRPNCPRPAV